MLIWMTGKSACGRMTIKGTNTPWSHPLLASNTGWNPAACKVAALWIGRCRYMRVRRLPMGSKNDDAAGIVEDVGMGLQNVDQRSLVVISH
jgi:hypothetical protein